MNQLYVIAMPVVGGEAPTVDVSTPSVATKRLTDIGADYFGWADDGKTITWAVGSSYFREPLSAITFEPPKDEKKEGEDKDADNKDSDKKVRPQTTPMQEGRQKRREERRKETNLKEQDKNVTEIAVDLEVPRKTPKGTIVLRGATVVTMKGDEVLKNADIVVENNRITRVGAKGTVPAGAKVFDVAGKTIVPGFVAVPSCQ